MTDAVMLERIAARRADLGLLEEQVVKQLAEVRVERGRAGGGRTRGAADQRAGLRISEQGFGEYLSLAPAP
ncbi:hypothetical protein P3T35_002368 [Kitasatospora sp. GP30]|uniref:hypothetical protein n=1 Tax=Kitasatospora sp. GP30 TaxID=3035084 RepID=UPI000CB81DC1|nr:hypothetical protein [Kitasatospora sp. GP30]MDH6140360.1 hypothetical protein [Kitasatospora sp. GP30]